MRTTEFRYSESLSLLLLSATHKLGMEPGTSIGQISPPHFQGLNMSLSLLSEDEKNTGFLKLKRGSNERVCLAWFLVVAAEFIDQPRIDIEQI